MLWDLGSARRRCKVRNKFLQTCAFLKESSNFFVSFILKLTLSRLDNTPLNVVHHHNVKRISALPRTSLRGTTRSLQRCISGALNTIRRSSLIASSRLRSRRVRLKGTFLSNAWWYQKCKRYLALTVMIGRNAANEIGKKPILVRMGLKSQNFVSSWSSDQPPSIQRKLHLFFLPVLFDKHFVTMNLVQMRPDCTHHVRNTLSRADVSKIPEWIVKIGSESMR